MKFWTYSELKNKVENDLDLKDEVFITDEEMLGYANEAIDEAEAEIATLFQDYYLTKTTVPLVDGQAAYDLPSDIYGNKIRAVIFQDGSTLYEVKQIRGQNLFLNAAAINQYSSSTDFYKYIVINTATDGYQMELYPVPRGTGTLTVWYIRNAAVLTGDTSVCDMPEAANFIMQFMKVRCYEKEPGNPNIPLAVAALESQRKKLQETLSNKVEDNDTTIVADLSFYEDFDDLNGGF